jgi:threonine synthase
MDFTYICSDCGKVFDNSKIVYRCPVCAESTSGLNFQSGNLIVQLDKKQLQELQKLEHVTAFDFFPFPVPTPAAYPVGNTPLVQAPGLSELYKLKNLKFKIEGANPSGSFKDRASQLVAAQALAMGEKKIVLASTGNAGSAMACAGAAYGLEIILFVPETAPVNKLMQSLIYGACVVPIKGTYDDAFALSIEYSEKFGGINRNTAYNPITIEGKKSVSIELFEQLGRKVPDAVYIPVGDGVILSGVYKGFTDLQRAGLITDIPKLICVQAEGSAAISHAFNTGEERLLDYSVTMADSISVASPAAGRLAVTALHGSQGWATIVSDQDISDAQLELAKQAGLFAEPAAAAAWAGVRADADKIKEVLGSEAEITVLLTGTGFKDMAAFSKSVSLPNAIKPNLQNAADFIQENK